METLGRRGKKKQTTSRKSPTLLNSRLSFAPATTCETRRKTSAIRGQKFHIDDVNLSWIRTEALIGWPKNFCINSATTIQCCYVQTSNYENLSSPFLEIAFNLFVQCSMSHRLDYQPLRPDTRKRRKSSLTVSSLKESQFQALYSFICGEENFLNLPTGSARNRQVANISNGATRSHVDAWGVSARAK